MHNYAQPIHTILKRRICENKEALNANGVTYEMHTYPGTRHGFHNYSTPRYDPVAAQLAWKRMVTFFKELLN